MGKVRRESLLTSIAAYAGGVLGAVNKIFLLPQIFSEEEVGLTNLLVSISAMLAQVGILGYSHVALRFFPYFRDKENGHNGFLSIGFILGAVGYALILGVFFLVKEPLIGYYSKKSALLIEYVPSLLLIAFCTVFFNVMMFYLRSMYKTFAPTLIKDVILRLMVTGTITLYALDIVDFHNFVIIYTGVNCSIVLMIVVYAMIRGQFFLRLPRLANMPKNAKQILVYAGTAFLSSSAMFFLTSLDGIMLAQMMGLDSVGVYVTILFITSFMLYPYRALLGTTGPKIAEFWEQNDIAGIGKMYKRVTLLTTTMGVFLLGGILLNTRNVLLMLTPEYAIGLYTLIALSIARFVDMVTGLNSSILATSKKFYWDTIFMVIIIGVAFTSNYFFIGMYGITGAALATLLTIVLFNVVRLTFVAIQFKIQPFTAALLWPLFFGAIAFAPAYFIPDFDPFILDILARSSLFTVIFGGLTIWKGYSPDVNKFVVLLMDKVKKK